MGSTFLAVVLRQTQDIAEAVRQLGLVRTAAFAHFVVRVNPRRQLRVHRLSPGVARCSKIVRAAPCPRRQEAAVSDDCPTDQAVSVLNQPGVLKQPGEESDIASQLNQHDQDDSPPQLLDARPRYRATTGADGSFAGLAVGADEVRLGGGRRRAASTLDRLGGVVCSNTIGKVRTSGSSLASEGRSWTCRCRWGESEFPVLPTAAIRCPRVTDWPGRTSALPRAALRSLT